MFRENEMTEALKAVINEPIKDKSRVALTEQDYCVKSYLKLYNE